MSIIIFASSMRVWWLRNMPYHHHRSSFTASSSLTQWQLFGPTCLTRESINQYASFHEADPSECWWSFNWKEASDDVNWSWIEKQSGMLASTRRFIIIETSSVETQSIIAITRLRPEQIVHIHKHGLPKRSRCDDSSSRALEVQLSKEGGLGGRMHHNHSF